MPSLLEIRGLVRRFGGLTAVNAVDLHVADLLNDQLPSHSDYTSQYDVLVFRRLASGGNGQPAPATPPAATPAAQCYVLV